jgi:hypothetical protein
MLFAKLVHAWDHSIPYKQDWHILSRLLCSHNTLHMIVLSCHSCAETVTACPYPISPHACRLQPLHNVKYIARCLSAVAVRWLDGCWEYLGVLSGLLIFAFRA